MSLASWRAQVQRNISLIRSDFNFGKKPFVEQGNKNDSFFEQFKRSSFLGGRNISRNSMNHKKREVFL